MTMNLSELARKRVAVAAYYFVPGVVFASWASRIPDVKHLLHLGNGQLGSVLFAITIVSSISFFGFLVGPPVIGWLSEATGLRIAISIAACFGLFIAFIAGKVSKRVEG